MFASTKLAALFSLFAVAAAAPAVFNPNDTKLDLVFRPPVTAPDASSVWPVGSVQTITWETKDIPEENKLQTGLILLGYIEEGDASGNEHLDVKHPLASNFPITAGAINVTVPEVESRKDYVVVLFGDSGNTSDKFTIIRPDVETSATSEAATATATAIETNA